MANDSFIDPHSLNEISLHSLLEAILYLKGKPFEDYVNRKLKDKTIERFRKKFFIQTK